MSEQPSASVDGEQRSVNTSNMANSSLIRSPITIVTLLFSGLLAWFLYEPAPGIEKDSSFDWSSVKPAKDLRMWHKCYEEFQCARLEVPVDWKNLSNPNKVVIAITKLPATVDTTDTSFGGTVILNPGGPGGSGVDFVRWNGKDVQEMLDSDKHFEILSFDPRGVHNTMPSTSCFSSGLARQVSELKTSALGTIDLSDDILNHKWASARSFAEACSETDIGRFPDGSNIRQFVSTSLVAEDMVTIIDRLEEYYRSKIQVGEGRILNSGEALLNYWGFSYGTLLGNTFASMFPSRIGHMILDGVVDAPDYMAAGWTTNLQDAMQNWDSFFQYCFDGGEKCPLYKTSDKSTYNIRTRVDTLLEGLKKDPIPLLNNGTAEVVRYTDVRTQIFQALYFPAGRFEPLANILSDLLDRNTSTIQPLLSKILPDGQQPPATEMKDTKLWNRGLPPPYPHQWEAGRSVLCGDGDSLLNRTPAEHKAYGELLLSQSSISAGFWSEIVLPCTAWGADLRPAEHNRFTGPFESRLADYDKRASPILWIGNTADPVTPIRNAYAMARHHEGSVVMQQDTLGHCTGPLIPSKCTYRVASRFFSEGILPDKGTVCQGDKVPWHD